uniref:ATP-binding protein n=1 Tax=Candidatus Desulfatibia profunda TaxID=2841695 RepID=A0A8J6TKE0_9BACT|nr:ATP-binding protein [Candidatus Desulfatibia profunda]
MIEHLEIKDFTVFDELKTDFVPGVNLFIGANGTGKTHLLKLLYSIQGTRIEKDFFQSIYEKILKVFLPHDLSFKRLIHRGKGEKKAAYISIAKNDQKMSFVIDGNGILTEAGIEYFKPEKAVYIPVKEMLANAPGFRSLYKEREIHFEEVYPDIIDKAFLPFLKNLRPDQEKILKILQKEMGGKVQLQKEEFFLRQKSAELEFTLVAEGIRKLALLWLLISNGALDKGTTLYWDEPETNLNPSMLQIVVKVLLSLEQMGVQMFIATHSYELLKEFELQQKEHSLCFYSLYKDKDTIKINSSKSYHKLFPNKIADEFSRIYDLEITRAMEGE